MGHANILHKIVFHFYCDLGGDVEILVKIIEAPDPDRVEPVRYVATQWPEQVGNRNVNRKES